MQQAGFSHPPQQVRPEFQGVRERRYPIPRRMIDISGTRRIMHVVTSASSAFPKSRHLLRHADFQRVYKAGRRQFTGNMTVFFLRRPAPPSGDEQSLRVGFTVGKVLGGSVERNRIKRRMREAVRKSWPAVEGPIDVVFHPRKSVLALPFAQVATEVGRGLQLAVQRAREAQDDPAANRMERK